MPILADLVQVVIGVDTHKHTHTAAVVAATGGVLATQTIPTTAAGYPDPCSPSLSSTRDDGCGRWREPAAMAPD